MLLHYFGSRLDELLLAIVEEVERRQAAMLLDLPGAAAVPKRAFATMWADLRRPELRPFERLFFECYAGAVCRARSRSPGSSPNAVDGSARRGRRADRRVAAMRRWSRLGLAVSARAAARSRGHRRRRRRRRGGPGVRGAAALRLRPARRACLPAVRRRRRPRPRTCRATRTAPR